MLQVDLRELRHGPVEVDGKLGPGDPLFEGLAVPLDGPVVVGGFLESAGHGGYFWHGRFEGRVRSACRRCLAEVVMTVAQEVDVVFSSDPELQDDLTPIRHFYLGDAAAVERAAQAVADQTKKKTE